MVTILASRVASACCLQGKNNDHCPTIEVAIVASACCLQGKNNYIAFSKMDILLHLPALCKAQTTY